MKTTFTKRLLKTALVLVLVIVLLLVLRFNCELREFSVVGSTIYTESELWNMSQSGPLDIYAPVYAFNINRGHYPKIPFIEKIEAKLTGLSGIELTVYEKKIIGCIYAMGGYFYFDRDGLIVDYLETKLDGVTLVEGAKTGSVVVGKNLKSLDNKGLFETVRNISLALEDTELKVDSVQFMYDDSVVLKVGVTDIRLGKHDDYTAAILALPDIINTLENKYYVLYMENYSDTQTTVVGRPKTAD